MPPQRLPIVNNDEGVWGDILRQYITKEHFNDDTDNPINGGHKTVTIQPGTTAAGTAPLTFTSGSLMTAAEAGAVEFNTDSLYFTITTGTVRKKVAIYDDTSGATGDLYYRNSGGNFVRLAAGADGKTLKVDGGLPTWGDPSFATATKTSNYTINGNDVVVFANAASGAVAISLPAASSVAGYRFIVKRVDNSGNNCTVVPDGSDTIDGSGSSLSLNLQYTAVTVVSNGSNWYIV